MNKNKNKIQKQINRILIQFNIKSLRSIIKFALSHQVHKIFEIYVKY